MSIRAGARGDAGMVPLSLRAPARILTAVGQARYVSVVCREWYGLVGVGRECRYLQQEYPVFSGFFVI